MAFVARSLHRLRTAHEAREEFGHHLANRGTLFANRLRIFQAEGLAHALFIAQTADVKARIKLEDKESVGAVIIQVAAHISVKPNQNRSDNDKRGNANHYTNDGQHRARLVFAHIFERHAGVFTELKAHPVSPWLTTPFQNSKRRASIGSSFEALCAG